MTASISLYQASVPVFARTLGSLVAILEKAEAFCTARKIDPSVLLQARLFPDMFPLARQIQIATDSAKGAIGRLSGTELPSYPDTETSFGELVARLQRTIAYVEGFSAADIDGNEGREIVLKIGGQPVVMTGLSFLLHFAYPNFYFHATTAYDILRHNGLELSKRDFLGAA